MGIVFLPGAMTGMIIAGAQPLDAVRLQVVIMYMLLAAVAVTATLIGLAVVGRLFTAGRVAACRERRLSSVVANEWAGGPSGRPPHFVLADPADPSSSHVQCTGSCCHDPGTISWSWSTW